MSRRILPEHEWRAREAKQSGPQEHACFTYPEREWLADSLPKQGELSRAGETPEEVAEWERLERWREWTRKPVKDISKPQPYISSPETDAYVSQGPFHCEHL